MIQFGNQIDSLVGPGLSGHCLRLLLEYRPGLRCLIAERDVLKDLFSGGQAAGASAAVARGSCTDLKPPADWPAIEREAL